MSHISLLLPFGLPPQELSTDLARALKTPALATLLTRTAASQRVETAPDSRMLPHEQWLAGAVGSNPPSGQFVVHPAHIEIARSHMMLNDLRRLQLSEEHSRALHALAEPMFTELGMTLDYIDASTWHLHAGEWAGLDCASPDAAAEQNISDWMPQGAAAAGFRKLQNEIQMLWYEHPANLAREQAGLRPVNAFWPWHGIQNQADRLLYTAHCPSWMTRLGKGEASLDQLLAAPAPVALVCGELCSAAIASDWGSWIVAMEELEQRWLAPLLAALRAGRIKRLRLVRSSREHLSESLITPGSLRKFWRAPSLSRLAT